MARANNKGFTLVEVLISIAFLTTIVTVAFSVIGPWLEFKNNASTQEKLERLAEDFKNIYLFHAFTLTNTTDQINLPFKDSRGVNSGTAFTFTVNDKSATDAASSCVNLTAQFQKIASEISMAPSDAAVDENGNNVCVFYYRNQAEYVSGAVSIGGTFVLASTGKDGVFDTLFNVARADQIIRQGDDIVLTINGSAIQRESIEKVVAQIDFAAKAYSDYFTARFLANPARDLTIYYFCNGYQANSTNPVANAVGNPPRDYDNTSSIDCTQNNLLDTIFEARTRAIRLMGLTTRDTYLVPGYDGIKVLTNNTATLTGIAEINSSGTPVTRSFSPKTPQTAGTVPPYTALVYARLPGNAVYVKTVVGNY